MDRPDSDASGLKSGNDTETEGSETDETVAETETTTDTTTEDSMSTNDMTTDESSDESESKPVAETPAQTQPVQFPIADIIESLIESKTGPGSQTKQMVALGGAAVIVAVYLGVQGHPSATLPPGVWESQVLPVVSTLIGVGLGSEAVHAGKKLNEKRK